jgi:uncharacterized protein
MYGPVALKDGDDVDLLSAAGLVLTVTDKGTHFQQPCTAFGAGQCGVYDGRPSVCRKYRCLLLRRYEAGDVSRSEASALIARTTALRDRVRSGLAVNAGAQDLLTLDSLCRLLLARIQAIPDQAAGRRDYADLLLDIAALRVTLAREFEPRDSESHQPDGLTVPPEVR